MARKNNGLSDMPANVPMPSSMVSTPQPDRPGTGKPKVTDWQLPPKPKAIDPQSRRKK